MSKSASDKELVNKSVDNKSVDNKSVDDTSSDDEPAVKSHYVCTYDPNALAREPLGIGILPLDAALNLICRLRYNGPHKQPYTDVVDEWCREQGDSELDQLNIAELCLANFLSDENEGQHEEKAAKILIRIAHTSTDDNLKRRAIKLSIRSFYGGMHIGCNFYLQRYYFNMLNPSVEELEENGEFLKDIQSNIDTIPEWEKGPASVKYEWQCESEVDQQRAWYRQHLNQVLCDKDFSNTNGQ